VPTSLDHLNRCEPGDFVATVGPVFERSPWIAAAAIEARPFRSRADLHAALCGVVGRASEAQQLDLIRAHPDLVARGALTAESSREQAAAGLVGLDADEIARFDRYNTAYKARFGFPFVICARRHRKEAILQAFERRLRRERAQEIATALGEICQIAELRLADLLA
jgi:2-oxo-4-hydroxy-4-carboxy-5-ureidoimidazoline decarboxylase